MAIHYHSAALFVSDIRASVRFYTELIGLKIEMDMGTNVILEHGITLWQINDDHIIVRTLGADALRRGGNRFELYFETDDIDEARDLMMKHGVDRLHEIHEESWGQRTIRVFDPDGHMVEIGESMKTFVSRMKGKGMSIEEIAAKTGLHPDFIENKI
jgi:catechol 2,3-dioxygenase-like lactoylglutathione lyase family enzyme